MNILAIETSCDETSVAILKNGTAVLTNTISSQIDLHRKTGGIVPEVAAREQVKAMIPVLDEALVDGGVTLDDIDMLAVTYGPGLVGALLVGVNTAKTLASLLDKPLVGVNHLEGHIYSNWLERGDAEIVFPVLVLVVSGGHNELILIREHGEYELVGRTRDDASGEAFDKAARLLGLSYPGGVSIQNSGKHGDRSAFTFPRAWLQQTHEGKKPKQITNYDFSFSGLKTAVWQAVKKHETLNESIIVDMAASVQEAIVEVLVEKTVAAAAEYNVQQIHIAGGVSASLRLREYMEERSEHPVLYPVKFPYCTDNAAMIGCAAYFTHKDGTLDSWRQLSANPNLSITYAA